MKQHLPPYRILNHNFYEDKPSVFVLISNEDEGIRQLGTAAEIMLKPFFYELSQKDVAAIVYTYSEEQFLQRKNGGPFLPQLGPLQVAEE